MEQAPPVTPDVEPLLTSKQVSRRLQVSVNTVHRLAESGAIVSQRVGRLRRFKASEVEAYIEACTHAATTGPEPIRSVVSA